MTFRTFPLQTNKERTYIRLTQVVSWLESDLIGGKKKSQRAPKMASVQYGTQLPIEDDIPENHCFFRGRSSAIVTRFLDDHNLQPGDLIKLERLAPYKYRFMPG